MSRANNREKYKEYDHNYYIKHKRPKSKIGQAELKIAELEEQLKNLKEKYVSMINENVIAFDKLEKELANAIVPKFKVGDYFIEHWDKETNIYQYQGNKQFKCLNKKQGYHCDYVILGALLLEKDFIKQISKEEAEAKLKELGE